MTELKEHQFEILPDAEASDGFVFGIGSSVSLADGGFDPGEASWLTQDTQSTRRGINAFGRDVLGAKTWAWSSFVDQVDVPSALDVLEQISTAWTPEALAREPGRRTAIRYRVGDRVRRVFGRPRRFAAPPSNLILSGYIPIDHDFQTVDSFTYDDEESSVDLSLASSVEGGGILFPLTLPIVAAPASESGIYNFSVGGTARAYPVIRFNGPWTNPTLTTDDWSLTWTGSIAEGDWVEIDTRPWMLTVLNRSGASVVGGADGVGGLSKRTYLEDIWFAPGSSPQVRLGGIAPSGSAFATLRWRNTYNSY